MFETVEVVRDRFVPVPGYLVAPVDVIVLPQTLDTIGLGAAFKQCQVRVKQCNGQLAEIGSIDPGGDSQ